jgi:hypothetical protein
VQTGSDPLHRHRPRASTHDRPRPTAILQHTAAWFNIQSVVNPSGDTFFAAWFANPSVSSLSWDLLATASAASIFIILEGRRLGIRWYWAYVIFSFVTAVAFTFPLFLAVRERRLAQVSAA